MPPNLTPRILHFSEFAFGSVSRVQLNVAQELLCGVSWKLADDETFAVDVTSVVDVDWTLGDRILKIAPILPDLPPYITEMPPSESIVEVRLVRGSNIDREGFVLCAAVLANTVTPTASNSVQWVGRSSATAYFRGSVAVTRVEGLCKATEFDFYCLWGQNPEIEEMKLITGPLVTYATHGFSTELRAAEVTTGSVTVAGASAHGGHDVVCVAVQTEGAEDEAVKPTLTQVLSGQGPDNTTAAAAALLDGSLVSDFEEFELTLEGLQPFSWHTVTCFVVYNGTTINQGSVGFSSELRAVRTNKESGIVGDPHILTSDGHTVDFFGVSGVSYTLYSSPSLYVEGLVQTALNGNATLVHPKRMQAGTLLAQVAQANNR